MHLQVLLTEHEARQQMRQNAQSTSEQYSIESNAKEFINHLGIR